MVGLRQGPWPQQHAGRRLVADLHHPVGLDHQDRVGQVLEDREETILLVGHPAVAVLKLRQEITGRMPRPLGHVGQLEEVKEAHDQQPGVGALGFGGVCEVYQVEVGLPVVDQQPSEHPQGNPPRPMAPGLLDPEGGLGNGLEVVVRTELHGPFTALEGDLQRRGDPRDREAPGLFQGGGVAREVPLSGKAQDPSDQPVLAGSQLLGKSPMDPASLVSGQDHARGRLRGRRVPRCPALPQVPF